MTYYTWLLPRGPSLASSNRLEAIHSSTSTVDKCAIDPSVVIASCYGQGQTAFFPPFFRRTYKRGKTGGRSLCPLYADKFITYQPNIQTAEEGEFVVTRKPHAPVSVCPSFVHYRPLLESCSRYRPIPNGRGTLRNFTSGGQQRANSTVRTQATSHAAVIDHLESTAPCLILVLRTGVEAGLEKP